MPPAASGTAPLPESARQAAPLPAADGMADNKSADKPRAYSQTVEDAKQKIQPTVMARLDISAASQLPRDELRGQLREIVSEALTENNVRLNAAEQQAVVDLILDDMLGLGPLEPLLADESITDILVNGPYQTYIERRGKLELTDVRFRNNDHVLNISRRIVSLIGRRGGRDQPPGRRTAAGWQPRQHHYSATCHRWRLNLDS